jgi:hypothetical protein
LKIYNNLVLPTFLYGSEKWTLTALQRRRIEAAEMKLLRPLAGYTLHDHKTNDSVRRELHYRCPSKLIHLYMIHDPCIYRVFQKELYNFESI